MLHPRYKRFFFLCFLICAYAFITFSINLPNDATRNNSGNKLALNENQQTKFDKFFEKINRLSENDNISLKNAVSCPVTIDTVGKTVIDVSCFGKNDGSISGISAVGPDPLYNYNWAGPGGPYFSPDLLNLSPGTYTLTVTDVTASCSATVSIDIISPVSLITIDVSSATFTELNCIGDSDGALGINVTATAPAVPLIEWFKEGVKIDQDVTFIQNLSAGSYEVIVTDTNSPLACSVSKTFEITEPEAFSFIKTNETDPICYNDPLGGTVTYQATGGTQPYYYSIDGGTPIPVPSATIYITGLSDGAHFIELTDSNNCNPLPPENQLVTFPSEIIINPTIVTVDDISCFAADDGAITPNSAVSGGTPPYNYTWSGPSGVIYTENIIGLLPGTYDLNVTDSKGCISGTESFVVADKQELVITNVNVPITDLLCAGDTDASITLEVSADPTSVLLIEWYLNGVLYTSGIGKSISTIGAGTYQVIVTDTNSLSSCSVSEIVVITEPSLFGAFISDTTVPDCFGDPNGATVTISLGGGTPPYFYAVDGAAPVSTGATPIVITDLTNGLHIFEVTDTNGCNPVSFNHTVNFPTEIIVDTQLVDITAITCFGAGDGTINMNISVSGGTAPYNYTWTGPAGGTNFGASIVNLIPGNYTLTVSDLLNCTSAPFSFVVPDKLALEISGFTQPIDRLQCAGDINGSIAIQIGRDPSSNIEIEWFKNGTSYDNSNVDNIVGLGAGIYEVIVTDVNSNSTCSVSQLFEITEPPVFEAEISSFSDPLCFDDIAGGTITLEFRGGTLPYAYSLDGGLAVTVNNNNPVVLTGLTDGSHSIFLTDSNGCNSQTIGHLVTYPLEMEIDYDPLTDILPVECGGGGEISVFVTGGTGTNYFYVWDGPSFGQSGFNLSTITNLQNGGVYNLTVFDENSCGSTQTTFVVPENPTAFTVSSVVNQQTCPTGEGNGSIILTLGNDITAPYFVTWEKWALTDPNDTGCINDCYSWQVVPDSANELVISELDDGEYRVTITDNGPINCNQEIQNFTIFENALEIVTEELELPTCAIEDAYYKFKLNNIGDVNFFLNGSPIVVGGPLLQLNQVTHEYSLQLIATNSTTNYLLKLTEQIPDGLGGFINGCDVFKGFVIDPYAPISYLGAGTNIIDMCEDSPLFKIEDLEVTGGTPFIDENGDPYYTYEWFGPNDFHSFGAEIPAVIGDYILIIGDNVDCESEPISITLNPDNEPIVVTDEIGDVTCDEENDGYISIEISGGKEPYTVVWEEEIPSADPGSSDPTYNFIGQNLLRLNDLEEGRYRLTVTSDLVACTTDNPAYQFQTIYSVNSSHTIAVIDGPYLDNELCAGNPGSLTIRVSDTRSGPIIFYYNGEIVGGENTGDNTYLIFIANPVENSILDVLNEIGCGEAIAFDIGLGDPSFQTSSDGYDFNRIVNLNEEVTFTNTSTDPYTRLEWDFDDGSEFSEEDSPVHVYQASGAYSVTLRVYNDLGCYKEFIEEIRVGEEYYIIFPDIFTPNNDGINDYFLGQMIGIDSFEFEIYDLWNNLLFARASRTTSAGNWGWDGNLSDGSAFNGKVFKYVFKGVDTSGQEVIISNQALLLR